MIIAVGMLASCASDDAADNGNATKYEGVVAEVSPMEDATKGTRSSLTFDAQRGMVFRWNNPTPIENADVLTVFPASGAASGLYTLRNFLDEDGTKAQFTAAGFSLSKDMRYYALSKKEDKGAHPNWNFPSAGNITVDYSGQRQAASGDTQTDHLGEYDFMAATALCAEQDQAYFAFKHLGLTLRMILTGVPQTVTENEEQKNVYFNELEIYDSENTFRQPIRTIDLTKGLDAQGNYTPAYNDLDVNNPSYNQRFKLALGADDNGIQVGSDKKLIAYIELPPFDFTGKKIVFSLKSKDGKNNYYGTYEGYKLNAGKAYQMTVAMQPATTYVVNVKVAHNWQLGDAEKPASAKTRATGDPGNDDGFVAPNYIYAFFCVDNEVQDYREITVAHSGENAWTDPDQNNVITYKTPLIFSANNPTDATSARVYIVASKTPLKGVGVTNPIPTITTGTTTEENVKDFKYDVQSVVTSNIAKDDSQQFLRDLYSTPWQSNETFVGKLTDPYQDVILYHTAAKVDLQWNSTAKITGDVKVNNVYSTNLSLFKPTANTSATTANYTVTSTLEADRFNYGRQVFYLPQFNTYNAWIGSKVVDTTPQAIHDETVTFSPATTNGFTSWLRWQKVY